MGLDVRSLTLSVTPEVESGGVPPLRSGRYRDLGGQSGGPAGHGPQTMVQGPQDPPWENAGKSRREPWGSAVEIAHDGGMRRQDVQDELQEGFEVGPVPGVGPDGAPELPPMRAAPPPRPRLCEAGPCQNYHRLEIQIDAEDPRAQTVPVSLPGVSRAVPVPGGSVYQAPAAFHTETHHYCYPAVGIEMVLGSLPVVRCNRWSPMVAGEWDPKETAREHFAVSPDGVRYQREVAAWEAARAAELAEAAEAERLIAASMAPPSDAYAVIEHYHFEAHGPGFDNGWAGLCDEFPSLAWADNSREMALAGIRRVVLQDVKDMMERGETPPPPQSKGTP